MAALLLYKVFWRAEPASLRDTLRKTYRVASLSTALGHGACRHEGASCAQLRSTRAGCSEHAASEHGFQQTRIGVYDGVSEMSRGRISCGPLWTAFEP